VNPLKAKIIERLRRSGPIGVGQYMHIALTDEDHGYYMRRDPFGVAGDFITAPEVSQMFGELIGLFFVQAWEDRGAPKKVHLVEMGPGRGTLMADILRAAKVRPAFLDAVEITLIEASPFLRGVQKETLAGAPVRWAEGLNELDNAPLFVLANEFFDALPVHQFVKSELGWHGRMVAAKGGELVFALTETLEPPDFASRRFRNAPRGSILEVGTEALIAVRAIADHIVKMGGAALILDYGHGESGLGDTFQAVKAHRYADPLAEPGEADLTFHVDFEALASAARERGAHVSGPITQADFLNALGIRTRAERLKRASPEAAADIEAALGRLTNPDEMGTLFKVLAICDGRSPRLPGFPC